MAQHNRVPITIRLEHFEGPLDLLLYLIQSHELNISKVSISKITDQYLAYVKLLQELNFDIASEFLVMAATLLLWKSRAILPADNDEGSAEDSDELTGPSPEDLVRQLIEHQRFLKAGDDLAQYPRLYEDVFTRSNTKPPVERIWREMNISDLTLSYQEALTKARKRKKVLKKETVSLSEKIWEFADKLTLNRVTELARLMAALPTRMEQVVTFLASLELARLKKVRVFQEGHYQPVYIELIDSMSNFNPELATGFAAEAEAAT